MTAIAAILCLALTRAEILERFRAPVVTQSDGLVQVYADCPEDMRREFQMPVASFAAETVKTLYSGLSMKSERFAKAGIVIHIGEIRTNVTDVISQVSTNAGRVVTRIYVLSPGYADLRRLRLETIKGFYRSVKATELDDDGAINAYCRADPHLRIYLERQKLDDWVLNGKGDVEEGLRYMRKVITPGRACAREVLVFASRLYLYPPQYDLKFIGGLDVVSFREALKLVNKDPRIRIVAAIKANEMPIFGGGRGEELSAAADAYMKFLRHLAANEDSEKELEQLLEDAEVKLNIAFEEARKR